MRIGIAVLVFSLLGCGQPVEPIEPVAPVPEEPRRPDDHGPLAVGFIELYATGNDRGVRVAPGDDMASRFHFSLQNLTDVALPIELETRVSGTAAAFATGEEDDAGSPLVRPVLGANERRTFSVWLKAPASAGEGERAVLTVQARAAKPHVQTAEAKLALEVSGTPTPSSPHLLGLQVFRFGGRLDDLDPTPLVLSAKMRFASSVASVTSADLVLRARVETADGRVDDWPVFFNARPRAIEAPGLFSTTLTGVEAGKLMTVDVAVRVPTRNQPGGADRVATITLTATTTNVTPATSVTLAPMQLRLRAR
ncbi:MAG: hypothetical protein Q8S33_00225 [Myxococcales bacterium]|nr:hypothetical protein [Myxococcales bacterium]